MEVKMGIIIREMVIGDKAEVTLEIICMIKAEAEVDLTKVQMLDIQW